MHCQVRLIRITNLTIYLVYYIDTRCSLLAKRYVVCEIFYLNSALLNSEYIEYNAMARVCCRYHLLRRNAIHSRNTETTINISFNIDDRFHFILLANERIYSIDLRSFRTDPVPIPSSFFQLKFMKLYVQCIPVRLR